MCVYVCVGMCVRVCVCVCAVLMRFERVGDHLYKWSTRVKKDRHLTVTDSTHSSGKAMEMRFVEVRTYVAI